MAKFLRVLLGIVLVAISLWIFLQLGSGLVSLRGSRETAAVFGYVISLVLPAGVLLLGVALIAKTISTVR